MLADFSVSFAGKVFECVDQGLQKNEVVDIVIRPEDLVLTSVAEA